MTIEKLILENYASIHTAMKCRRIEIDFSKRKNKICLLIAPNGGGKTSILSAMQPFASLGNLDVRDSQPLILKYEKGYKEIHYRKRGDYYVIKHFYTPTKETHSVKSYIEKNGVELNTNGNVRSFLEFVKIELDLELDYLKLVRLGSNVTNLIKLKTTERKNFMSKLLEDTDVYLSLYKKQSAMINELKTLINHALDKLRKTGISDLENAVRMENAWAREIDEKQATLKDYQDQLAVTHAKIQELPAKDELLSVGIKTKKQLEKLSKSVEQQVTLESVEQEIAQVTEQIRATELLSTNSQAIYTSKYESLDAYYKERDQLEHDLEKIKKNSNLISLENIVADLDYRVRNEDRFAEVSFSYTKNELEQFIKFVEDQQDALDAIYSFGQPAILRVLELKEQQISVDQYIKTAIMELENSEFENASRIVFQRLKKEFSNLPPCVYHHDSCRYIELYDALTNLQYQHSEKGKEESMTMLQYMDMVNLRLKKFFDKFPENQALFRKMPKDIQEMFTTNQILEKIRNMQSIYPRERLFQLLSEITEYDNFQELKAELAKKRGELKEERKRNYLEFVSNRWNTVVTTIGEIEESIHEIRSEWENQKCQLQEATEQLEYLMDLKEVLEKKDTIRQQYEEAATQIKQLIDLQEFHSKLTFRINCLQNDLQKKEKDTQYLSFQISEYQKLQKELDRYKDILDEAGAIKDAWSTKKGVPLKLIQIYLTGIRDSANDLMDIVYHGESYIESFDINESEFRIPFVTKGVLVDDAVYASQGEESFLSISLSFALTAKNMTNYDIMLLDEIDSTLDSTNRIRFIAMLDRQIERTGSEQCFAITHNNMFDMYPVDVLLLSGERDLENELLNYIDIKIS